jgi:hypothetical protein
MKSELQLIKLAEMHLEDSVANLYMKELKTKFDSTYMWCMDCDGRVFKEKQCCMNCISKNDSFELEVDCVW